MTSNGELAMFPVGVIHTQKLLDGCSLPWMDGYLLSNLLSISNFSSMQHRVGTASNVARPSLDLT
jgi:hypothetical protein